MRFEDLSRENLWWKFGNEFQIYDRHLKELKEAFIEFKRKPIDLATGNAIITAPFFQKRLQPCRLKPGNCRQQLVQQSCCQPVPVLLKRYLDHCQASEFLLPQALLLRILIRFVMLAIAAAGKWVMLLLKRQ